MKFSDPGWGRRIIRAIAVLNILFAAFGGYAAAAGAAPIIARVHNSPAEPYVRQVYFISTFVAAGCLIMLVVGAAYLLRLNRLGLRICNVVFAIEIAWFLANALLLPLIWVMSGGRAHAFTDSIAGATGIGGIGTTPQIVTGYPVLALIFLNLARGGFPNHAPHT